MPQTFLINGPVNSERVARIHALLQAHWGRALLLVPAREYALRRLESVVTALDLPGVWGRPVEALADFARDLLVGEGVAAERAGSFQRRLILQGCIERLRATPEVAALGDSVALPGFVSHLLRMIVQLKQMAIEPEEFARIIAQRQAPRELDRAVVALYQAYQDELREQGLYDVPGLFWQARLACEARRPVVLEGIDAIFLDGFDDFTPSEFRLLEALAPHVQTCVIGLNYDAEPDRREVYYLPAQTLNRITKRFDPKPETFAAAAPETYCSYAARHIFWRSQPAGPAGMQQNLAIVPCEDAVHEIEVIGRRIKKLLIEDGVPIDQVAVLCPDLNASGETIRSVFAEFGIPVRVPQSPSLAQSVFGGFVLRLMDLADHWERESVIDALQSPWFAERVDDGALPLLARRAQIVSGYAEWRARLDALQRRLSHTDQREVIDLLKRLPEAEAWLQHYLQELERLRGLVQLPESATPEDYCDALAQMIAALRPRAHDSEEAEVRRGLHEVIALLRKMPAEKLPRQDFIAWFRRGCEETSYTRQQPRPAVSCLTLESARNLQFDHVFLCGMNEGVFPRTLPINALYSDADLRELRALGLALEGRKEQSAREQLLFHHALLCARQRLTLTYALRDRQGREALPSPYLKDVLELFAGVEVREPEPVADTFVPAVEEVACPRDLANAVLYGGLEVDGAGLTSPTPFKGGKDATDTGVDGGPSRSTDSQLDLFNTNEDRRPTPPLKGVPESSRAGDVTPATSTQPHLADTNDLPIPHSASALVRLRRIPHFLASAAIEQQRHDASPFGAYDAVLADSDLIAAIATRFGEDHRFSVSQLEAYLECPFQFFENHVLHIDPSEPPLPEMDPAMRGSLMHEVLCRFHTHYRGTPVADIPENEALQEMEQTVEAVFQERGWQAAAAPPGVLRVEQARMNVLLARYLKLERNAKQAQWQPQYFEVDFGVDTGGAAPSTAEPFLYDTDLGPVRFRGRIDRIDLHGRDARIMDYKTGNLPAAKDINGGLKVQLSIYAEALEELLMPDHACLEACFLKVGEEKRVDALSCGRSKDDQASRESNTRSQVAQAVERIRSGWFPPLRRGKHCYGCGHARPCRYDKGRMLLKAPDTGCDEEEEDDE
ncbi:MAG: exodeoxyribonuclease V subunit gamma [Candidatus Hydrogenedentes bacterium]|nr:exodeoxyribonuclease V subunit gamma [Candidatus Hydrogenedentota bacterium]